MIQNYSASYTHPFVGRKKELQDITARLRNPDCRVLTITGLGGSGKTRLALEAASAIADQFADGVALVRLQPIARSEHILGAIAQAVGLTIYSGEPRDQLFEYLRDKSFLLVLDNFEHMLDSATLLSDALAIARNLSILVTSREALNIQEEWLYPLHGMAIPHSVYSTALEEYEAVQLFLSHARRIQPHFNPVDQHEAIVRICMLTTGLPLALELAASWLKGLNATTIAHEMQRNLDILATTARNVEERHRSIRAVFDQSWALLSDHEQHVFARLAVFAGGFDSDAAEHVAAASFTSLAALVEKSLVHLIAANRFGIHELLRQYAMEQLLALGEIEATNAQHSHFFADRMAEYEQQLKQPQQLETMQAIERDFENIRRAWEWSIAHQDAANIQTMINSLYLFGFLRSRYRETKAMFEQALAQPVATGRLLGQLLARRWGYLHWGNEVNLPETQQQLEHALQIAQTNDDRFELAFVHLIIAYMMIGTQQYEEALLHLETSKSLFEQLHEPYYVCWVLHRLGYAHYNLNQNEEGKSYTQQSLMLARTSHNYVAQVICLYNLGSDYILGCDYVNGRKYCAEALDVATRLQHKDQTAHAISLLALCDFCEANYTECEMWAIQSQAIIEEIVSYIFEPYNLSLLILLACIREDYAKAKQLEISKHYTYTNKMGQQLMYWALATVACGLNEPSAAYAFIQQELALSDLASEAGVINWLAPSAAYVLATSHPEQAIQLVAWIYSDSDRGLDWARRWPLITRLHTTLQAHPTYQQHWEIGTTYNITTAGARLQEAFNTDADTSVEASAAQQLTSRELEILQLLAEGLTNPQIAARLVIGAGTVKTHTLNIYRKLDVANRTQAIMRAQELGFLRA